MATIFISFPAPPVAVLPVFIVAPPVLLDAEWQTDALPVTVVAP